MIGGKVSVAFPVDVDASRIERCLSSSLPGRPPVSVGRLSKANLCIEFCINADSSGASRNAVSREIVAASLAAAQPDLNAMLRDCIQPVAIINTTATTNRVVDFSDTNASTGEEKAVISTEHCKNIQELDGLIAVAREEAIQTVLSDPDASASQLPSAALRRALLEAFYDAVSRKVFPFGQDTPAAEVSAHQRLIADAAAPCVNGFSQCAGATAVHSEVSCDDDELQRRCQELEAEVRCLVGISGSLECDLATSKERHAAADSAMQALRQRFSALENNLLSVTAERDRWRARAQESEAAMLLSVETVPSCLSTTSPPCRSGDDAQDNGTMEQLLRMLSQREDHVRKLNDQLLAARKESLTLKRQLANVSSCCSDSMRSSSSTSQCASRSASVGDGSLSRQNETAVVQLSSDIMIPKSAVEALEQRCWEAEQALRERTMQIASLLNVKQKSFATAAA